MFGASSSVIPRPLAVRILGRKEGFERKPRMACMIRPKAKDRLAKLFWPDFWKRTESPCRVGGERIRSLSIVHVIAKATRFATVATADKTVATPYQHSSVGTDRSPNLD